MGAHFAAVNRVFFAHALFDERMTGFRHHRRAARRAHYVDGVPGEARIVNDFRARIFFEEGFSQQADDVIAFDKLAVLIEQEAAVKVAVKGDAHVRAVLNHRIAGIIPALGQ
ncbi:hypothetical protein D3C72_1539270 [compost metagenome]